MVNSFWDAAAKAQKFTNNIYDRQQADLDRLHTQIGDALGAADDENHYNQIVSALGNSGIDVSKYKLKPNGPSWETMRDLALSQIGKAMAQKTVRANLDAQKASLYTPYAGTVGGAPSQSPNALAPQAAPAQPVTPAFDFSTMPTSPGITTPQANPETGESEALPQTGTPAPTMEQTPEGLPLSPDVKNPLIQAASKIDQAYPELDAKPISPPYVTRTPLERPQSAVQPDKRSEAIYYAPKLPGQQGFVHRFPEGFKKEVDSSEDKRPTQIKEAEYWQGKLKDEFGVEPPLAQVPSIMDWRKQGIPFKVENGVFKPTNEFVEGTKAAERSTRLDVAQQRADQSAMTASEKNFQSWAADVKATGATNSTENLRYLYTQERKGKEVKFDPQSKMMVLTSGGASEPNDIRSLRAKQDDLFDEFKDKGLLKKPSLTQTESIQKARDSGVNFEVRDGELVPTGDYAAGSKAAFESQKIAISQQRTNQLAKTAKQKDLESFISDARAMGSTDDPMKLRAVQESIKNGGIPEVDPATGRISVTGAYAGSKAANMANQLKIADEKLGLQRDRLDLAKKTQTERQDLLERKLTQLQDYQSLDHQSKLAMAKGLANADAKMYPRISAGFTLMGHIQELDKTVRSNPKMTDEVVGWLSSQGTYQDLKNELNYIVANPEQYKKSTGRSEQFIKIAMGLASLDAEIDRAYFQGQGNLAEESRKRLDAMVLGLKKAPNAQVFMAGLNCLKGYVNEIIDTALPSDFAHNPAIQATHARKVPEIENYRHQFNNAVAQGTPPGQTPVQMPGNTGSAHLNIPMFTQDDPNVKGTIDSQLKDGTLQHGQVIQVKTKDGAIHEVRLP